MGFWCAKASLMECHRQEILRDPKPLLKLERTLKGQDRFALEGPEYRRPKPCPEAELSAWFNKNLEVVETFGALLIYIAIMNFVGFIIASIFYIFVQTLILMPKGEKSYVKAGVIAVIFSVATYYIFVYWLAVLLPVGAIFE